MSASTHTDNHLAPANPADDSTIPTAMTTGDRIGLAASALMFLGGLWLMAAPFIVDYQSRGSDWTGGTISIFAVGGSVSVIALIMIVAVVGGFLSDLSRSARRGHGDRAPAHSQG